MDDSPHGKAVAAVNAMSLAERVGQLVMAPLYAGSDPSSLQDLIANQHVGSVLIIGNWNSGTAGVAAATSALQSYAPANPFMDSEVPALTFFSSTSKSVLPA